MKILTAVVYLGVFFGAIRCETLSDSGYHAKSSASGYRGKISEPTFNIRTGEQAIGLMELPPGFVAELVASEPMIEEPVAIAWAPDGKLFVVEMRGYMQDLKATNEKAPVGRVSLLEDTDNDGRMDKKTIFLDNLVEPRAVLPLEQGTAIIAEPPNLWLAKDTDGDGRADIKEKIFSRYGSSVFDAEHNPNGLLWGIDNWIYSAHYKKKFRFENNKLTVRRTRYRGQWGISQDDLGRLYYNTSHDAFQGDGIGQSFGRHNSEKAYRFLAKYLDDFQLVWPAILSPDVFSASNPEPSFGSASGALIYRGNQFPDEFYGNYFVTDPTVRLVRRGIIVSRKSGRAVRNPYEKEQREFLRSADPFFRPVSVSNGPDGCLYVVDMYRGVIQHKVGFGNSKAIQFIEKHGLPKVVRRGRIYRIRHKSKVLSTLPKLSGLNSEGLIKHLSHSNGWVRDEAQKLLVLKQDYSIVSQLSEVLKHSPSPEGRLHALWSLSGLNKLNSELIRHALNDKDYRVRFGGIKASNSLLKEAKSRPLILKYLATMVNDPSPVVVQQLVASVGQIKRSKEVAKIIVDVVLKSPMDSTLRNIVLGAIEKNESKFFGVLLKDGRLSSVYPELSLTVFKPFFVGVSGGERSKTSSLFDSLTSDKSAPYYKSAFLLGTMFSRSDSFSTHFKVLLGQDLYQSTCLACHNKAAPNLMKSKIIAGDVTVPIRILLHGLHGPIEGKDYGVMPTFGLKESEIARVLTYLRKTQELEQPAVTLSQVKKVKAQYSNRNRPWTMAELNLDRAEDLLSLYRTASLEGKKQLLHLGFHRLSNGLRESKMKHLRRASKRFLESLPRESTFEYDMYHAVLEKNEYQLLNTLILLSRVNGIGLRPDYSRAILTELAENRSPSLSRLVIQYLLTDEALRNIYLKPLLKQLLVSGDFHGKCGYSKRILSLYTMPFFIENPMAANVVRKFLNVNRQLAHFALRPIGSNYWASEAEGSKLLLDVIQAFVGIEKKINSAQFELLTKTVFTKDHWASHPDGLKLLSYVIQKVKPMGPLSVENALWAKIKATKGWAKRNDLPDGLPEDLRDFNDLI